jgi:hypothetical protein
MRSFKDVLFYSSPTITREFIFYSVGSKLSGVCRKKGRTVQILYKYTNDSMKEKQSNLFLLHAFSFHLDE